MNLAVQAAPVVRGGLARAHQADALNQSCNVFKCGAKVITCAGQCFPNPFNAGCISCLGSAWDECKSCF
jgi:hypothetical protein